MDLNVVLFLAIYNAFNNLAATLFFNAITWAGNIFFWAAVGMALVLKRRKKPAVDLLVAGMLVILIVQGLKWELMVPRPFEVLPGVSSLIMGPSDADPSFPSGHAAIAAMGAVVLGSYYPRRRIHLALLVFLIMLSRIYLGMHYPFDVIVGALIGSAIAWLTVKWKSDNRFAEKIIGKLREL